MEWYDVVLKVLLYAGLGVVGLEMLYLAFGAPIARRIIKRRIEKEHQEEANDERSEEDA